jgi:hypothetical protein
MIGTIHLLQFSGHFTVSCLISNMPVVACSTLGIFIEGQNVGLGPSSTPRYLTLKRSPAILKALRHLFMR